MSIGQRIKAIENKVGIRIEPLVVFVVRRGPASRTNADIGRAMSAAGTERDRIVQALLAQSMARSRDD